MINKRLDDIDANDLQGLCDRRVRESGELDFKETVPRKDDKGKSEFLRDVTSLANTNGGDLVYGVTEEREADGSNTGIAATAPGIGNLNVDEQTLWMLNVIRDNRQARLVGVQFQTAALHSSHTS